MDEPLISIVVPIYNTARYLDRCINTLVNQTYSNLEIVLINDGSTDNSEDICLRYCNMYDNVKYYHKTNGGLGSARNYGIERSHGAYVGFIDSDDWVDLDYFYFLYHLAATYDAQVASCSMDVTSVYALNKKSLTNRNVQVIHDTNIPTYYFKMSLKDSNLFSVCSSIFIRSSLDNVRFREGKLNEDMDFKYKALKNATTWVLSNAPKYHYYQAGGSLSSGIVKAKDLDLIEASHILLKYAEDTCSNKNYNYARIGTIKPYFSLLLRMAVFGSTTEVNEEDLIKEGLSIMRENYLNLIMSPIKASRKVLITSMCINYRLTRSILVILKKIV